MASRVRRRPLYALALAGLLAALSPGCSDEGCGEPLRIVAPEDGATVSGESLELAIDACGLERDTLIVAQLVSPVESDYASWVFLADDVYTESVPTLPGEMCFQLVTRSDEGDGPPTPQTCVTVER